MLATDHAPHTMEDKLSPLAEAPFGIASLEVALPAVWHNLVDKGRLSVNRLIEAWSQFPARRFNLPGGTLKPGSYADMVLFNPVYRETIKAPDLVSKAQNTPFLDQELQGFPVMVWVGGRLVQKDRKVLNGA